MRGRGAITEGIANEIFDILVMCGGANEDNRSNFVWLHIKDEFPCREYRFQGHFGFGGKFYSDQGGRECPWRVGYHPDDVKHNPGIHESLCTATNLLLFQIWERHDHDSDEIRQRKQG